MPMIGGSGLQNLADPGWPTAGDSAQGDRRRGVDGDADGGVDELANLGNLQRRHRRDDVGDGRQRPDFVIGGAARVVAGEDHGDAAVEKAPRHAGQLAQGCGVGVVGVVDDDGRRRRRHVHVAGQTRGQARDRGRGGGAAGAGFQERSLGQRIGGGRTGAGGDVLQDAARAVGLPWQGGHVNPLEAGQVRQDLAHQRRLPRPRRSGEDGQDALARAHGLDPVDQRARGGAADRVLHRGTW